MLRWCCHKRTETCKFDSLHQTQTGEQKWLFIYIFLGNLSWCNWGKNILFKCKKKLCLFRNPSHAFAEIFPPLPGISIHNHRSNMGVKTLWRVNFRWWASILQTPWTWGTLLNFNQKKCSWKRGNRNGTNGAIWNLGTDDSWQHWNWKISWHCSF